MIFRRSVRARPRSGRKAEVLDLSDGGLHYEPKPISAKDLELMRCIDRLHTDRPFMGVRMLRDRLKIDGYTDGRRHVTRLTTTKRNPEHPARSRGHSPPDDGSSSNRRASTRCARFQAAVGPRSGEKEEVSRVRFAAE